MTEKYTCGNNVEESGTYGCLNCGQTLELNEGDKLPPCPRCTNQSFEKITESNRDKFVQLDNEYTKNDSNNNNN
ncbi:MAG: hypothetical protein IJZ29_04980 [Clostridia bacterium]|nr:hypothetical protein [Clostridia bacterium]